ncbi:MAG: hypothetical protein IPP54_24090 [Anaerolineales bacterium]|nr:hypothetical protein [Anaerolineales bacterium]
MYDVEDFIAIVNPPEAAIPAISLQEKCLLLKMDRSKQAGE